MSVISAGTTSTTAYVVTPDTTGEFVVKTGASNVTAITVDASQNVGIGTSSPSYNLDVSTTVAGQPIARFQNTTSNEASIRYTTAHSSSSDYKVGASITVANAFEIYSVAAGATRALIDASGNLLVGTTTVSNSGKVNVFGASGTTGVNIQMEGVLSVQTPARFMYGASNVGSITCNSTATGYNTSSDYRLKEAIAPMTGALAKVALLKPCTYKWKVNGSDGQGFIAHELAEVEPGCVTGEKDAVDAKGKPQYQGIDTSFLVATLTAAIQEQQAMIEELKAKVAALEQR